MKSQSAFVRPDRAVLLDPEPAIDVDLALVVLPWHPEHDHAFRFNNSLENFGFPVMRISIQHQGERLDYFLHRLVKLGFARVFGLHLGHQIRNVILHVAVTREWTRNLAASLHETRGTSWPAAP